MILKCLVENVIGHLNVKITESQNAKKKTQKIKTVLRRTALTNMETEK